MKKTTVQLLVCGVLIAAATSYGQGLVNFNSTGTGVRAPVYNVDPSAPTEAKQGNTAQGIPAGTQTYAGPTLAGPGYTAALFGGAPSVVDADSLSFLGSTVFRTNPTGTFAGHVVTPGNVEVPGVAAGTAGAKFELRAWDNRGGTVTSWAQVVADRTIAQGRSGIFAIPGQLGDGSTITAPNLVGLQSFQLAVPEPSIIALGVLGIGALVLFRRRQS